ncbi:MAG: hypothetical protein FJY56_20510 [Betaproteobacteria bacterium]|nr:hypothetical protein [Betaproteobacteria bacterium]
MALERQGIPTATFITDAFSAYARGLARMQNMVALPEVVIPHPIAGRSNDELRDKVRRVYDEVKAALTIT